MTVMGIDEVGRGCWAGPLVAGAVVLPPSFKLPETGGWRLADSKIMTARQRAVADKGIRSVALAIGLGWVTNDEIDKVGLTAAVSIAMRRAIEAISIVTEEIIIDGKFNFLPDIAGSRAIVKADGSVPAVSAASIVAKVARDKWMAEKAAKLHPGYGFERHVGYGTRQHQTALTALGVSPLHRRSFRPVSMLLP